MLPLPPRFRQLHAAATQSGLGCSLGCSSALRSSRLSAVLFTTTASADFSAILTAEISPGKVHEHILTRAVRLYLMRLSVTVGFRVS
jgi:hypothetical protein